MKRIAAVIGIEDSDVEEYERLHRDVWPEVLARLTNSHVTNYSIYRFGHILFSYMEYTGNDYEKDMAAIADDPITQDWWKICMPLQRPFSEKKPHEWWMELPELFHLD